MSLSLLIQPPLPLFEADAGSDYTLRWNQGHHSWRHVSEGGFDQRKYEVREILTDTEARTLIELHHYSHKYVAAKKRYGLYTGPHFEELVGVMVLSNPMNNKTLTNVFPDLLPLYESIELGRLVLLSEVPANAESFFVAQAWKLAALAGIRGIVSFADPVPRTNQQGELCFKGHVGTIYQSLNMIKSGRSTPRTRTIFPDGTEFVDRTRQKILGQERGAEEAEKLLIQWGARPRRAGESPATWLHEQLAILPLRTFRHPGNHRYIRAIGPKRKQVSMRVTPQPYPKQPDPLPL